MSNTGKAFALILTTALAAILVSMIITAAGAQDIGFQWTGGKSGEEYITHYVNYREKLPLAGCYDCYKMQEYLYQNDPASWWLIGIQLNPGYGIDFWPESSYVLITDVEGNQYQSIDWMISQPLGTAYWTSGQGAAVSLQHSMMKNEIGHNVIFFRFDWKDRPGRVAECEFFGIQSRRLFK